MESIFVLRGFLYHRNTESITIKAGKYTHNMIAFTFNKYEIKTRKARILLGLADTDTFKKYSILVPLKCEQSAAFYIVHTDMMMPFQSHSLQLFRP